MTTQIGIRTVHEGYNGHVSKVAVCMDSTGGFYAVHPSGYFTFDSMYQIALAPDSDGPFEPHYPTT